MEQITFADRVVLNKTDLVDDAEIESVRRRVQAINSAVRILPSRHADVALEGAAGARFRPGQGPGR